MMKKYIALAAVCCLIAGGLFYLHRAPVPEGAPKTDGAEETVPLPAPAQRIASATEGKPARTGAPQNIALSPVPPALTNTPAALMPAVRLAIGLDSEKGYQPRMDAVKRLGVKMPADDIAAVYAFFDVKFKEQGDLDLVSFNAVKNDLLNVLIAQEQLPQDLGRRLVSMYRNPDNDDLWRDYSLQHIAMYCERRWRDAEVAPDDGERREFAAAFRSAFNERKTHIAGTALLGWDCLSGRYPEFGRSELEKQVLEIARDPRACVAARATALSLCGSCNLTDALPLVRVAAQAGEETSLRLAAISALGQLGGKDDQELLQSIAAGPSKLEKQCAEIALKALSTRVSGAGK